MKLFTRIGTKSPFIKQLDIAPYRSGPLSGLTCGIKDVIDVAGEVTGFGSPAWQREQTEAVAHAMCVEQLLGSGATINGKLITDELTFSLIGDNPHYGTPLNPKAPDRVPGGSSSGSASAVAQGLCDLALGTDTGGSVRVPASYCGLFGYRPSHDRISTSGVRPLAQSFDTVGLFATSLERLEQGVSCLLHEGEGPLERCELLVWQEGWERCDPTIQAVYSLKDYPRVRLNEVVGAAELETLYCQLMWSEAWNNYGQWVKRHRNQIGKVCAERFRVASQVERDQLSSFGQQRERWCRQINRFLEAGRFLLFPTTPTVAPLLRESQNLGKDHYPRILAQTALAGLGRLCQITLPLKTVDGAPIGLSIVGGAGQDLALFEACRSFLESEGIKAIHSTK